MALVKLMTVALGLGLAASAEILAGESIITPLGSSSLTTGAELACSQLADLYPDQTLLPESDGYTFEATNYWDVRANLDPYCIFFPESAEEVSDGIRKIVAANAQFAVRGGGHMNYPGSNNIEGGVLVALSKLQEIQVNDDTVEVGPGLRWDEVYSALEPYGRLTLGGRLKSIGVPGLTLIGGFHYFINKYGFVMDTVVSYDVVLGNGTQVTASATCNRDLFWALKGGASNFGIVAKFVFQTYEIPQISTTIQAYSEDQIPQFIKAITDMAVVDDAYPIAAGGVFTVTYNVSGKEATASVLGLQEGFSNPPSQFANFTSIPGQIKLHNVTTAAQWAKGLDTPNQMYRVMFSHRTVKPDPAVLYEMYQAWRRGIESISDVAGLCPTFVLNVIPRGAARVGKTNGIGNVWSLDDDQAWIIWQFSTSWAHEQDDLRVQAWSRQLITNLHEKYKVKDLTSEFVYMGDAGEWQDPYLGFPEENIQKMRDVQAGYDANGVFSSLNWGGFKLGVPV
ncbi:hypothetical protein ASPWEDRAFT_122609 [Aspergillus wentii DTO 134E9]|uniref:FAD-binding PCMH-type domain-containing protein n=1 Tax=Aspergillus wentii DTO 134E9 TaxID=1073089 RepID=A0A1L9RYR4_ASPWE|nr:uncharacterized protein ASPWEDRAFT_122609 [Aspergillus wentii DTO 134E9]KAI9932447.1 hypothetical protein MW887_008688 [Aspergillus wentii]OJJ40014.1 hypothetical protein ASPWEDRAFT_122609 [Aspergillus wentii DTO 134E9]